MPRRRRDPYPKPDNWHHAKRPAPVPRTSWWIGLTREEFAAVVKAKQDEIQNTREGQKIQRAWTTAT